MSSNIVLRYPVVLGGDTLLFGKDDVVDYLRQHGYVYTEDGWCLGWLFKEWPPHHMNDRFLFEVVYAAWCFRVATPKGGKGFRAMDEAVRYYLGET